MLIDSLKYQQIESLLWDDIPFAAYVLPGEKSLRVITDAVDAPKFSTTLWLQPFEERKTICSAKPLTPTLPKISTPKAKYLSAVKEISAECEQHGGKVVYSRVIYGKTITPWWKVAAQLFEQFPNTFRYIFHIPSLGSWIGATPEPLFRYNRSTGQFITISLAGTRRKVGSTPWDEKNIREHELVVSYITRQLRALGIAYEVSERQNVSYGSIEHLCHYIRGHCAESQVAEIINRLNPTPALCGDPKKRAIEMINRLECQPRQCYGGLLVADDGVNLDVFVNLRCLRFDGQEYWIYAGGGITALSDPETEWRETEAKTEYLRSIL